MPPSFPIWCILSSSAILEGVGAPQAVASLPAPPTLAEALAVLLSTVGFLAVAALPLGLDSIGVCSRKGERIFGNYFINGFRPPHIVSLVMARIAQTGLQSGYVYFLAHLACGKANTVHLQTLAFPAVAASGLGLEAKQWRVNCHG